VKVSSWLQKIKSSKQKSEIEKKLLNYVKKHQGKINLKECAHEIDLTEEQVKEALSRLEQKGIVKRRK